MYLVFDTETTGFPKNFHAPITDLANWPRVVQLAWQLHGDTGQLLSHQNHIVYPDGFDIPFRAEQVHGISTERARREGRPLDDVLRRFEADLERADVLVGHNINFDVNVVGCEYVRQGLPTAALMKRQRIDTMKASVAYCSLPGGPGGKFKAPKLGELYQRLFDEPLVDAHDAAADVGATARSFFALVKKKVIIPPHPVSLENIAYEAPPPPVVAKPAKEEAVVAAVPAPSKSERPLPAHPFSHLHVHSQFSVLEATPSVEALIAQAKKYDMPAVALTDLGNMYGAFKFVGEALHSGIKPIVGCELFVSEERKKTKFTRDNPDRRYRQPLLAKDKEGYLNLIKLSSLGFTEGLYGAYPRVDKELIAAHRKGLIALTGGLAGEVPHLILHMGEKHAEEAFVWWRELFGEDFYAELNRHGTPEEQRINETLLGFCKKYGVRYVAANESYYLHKGDADAHDILLCVKDGELKSTPIGHGRGYRRGMPNDAFYFKTQQEMKELFSDLPEALAAVDEIVKKVETYDLRQSSLLPQYNVPKEFADEDAYLRHLTYQGARKRYPELSPEIQQRLDFELETIKKIGYPGYFLITQDFTGKAREMGVYVGPGRGSAAGSAVAYCIGITNVDPIAYNLLFERFLNPDRISLPDIDIDFDDEGRDKALAYVIEKYGAQQVAQIITYGTMAARSSIRDCARVLELPLSDANYLAGLVPSRPGYSLQRAFAEVSELKEIKDGDDLRAKTLRQATVLEGSLRNTGTHACGVIITPRRLDTLIPVAKTRDSDMLITQFDNSVVEQAGLLKMDFLGLTTLTIIRTAQRNIEKRHGVHIDIEDIPLNDVKTFELYQRGDTAGTFQFESDGMQAYLKQLKPDKLEDLIAMNALYRPGPMEYIPNFIARKSGKETIHYDLPEMEEVLRETYGITVYQEQVMLLSQQLAGFSKGDADTLRKAMGKKQKDMLDAMKDKFIEGCRARGHEQRIAEKIWKDWEAFAQYAFNKSHSTCYSLIAYQTAYLKANYATEYMAAVLTHSRHNIDKITFFIEECRRQHIEVLGPDINESGIFFEVNPQGCIRFGLGAIKGIGEGVAKALIAEREKQGPFRTLFEVVVRLSAQVATKKTIECLALSGALDRFTEFHRRQFIASDQGSPNLTEKLMRYATKMRQEALSRQGNLFGDAFSHTISLPKIFEISPFSEIEKLNFEKEVIGMYISGHPLDSFKFEMDAFCNTPLAQLADLSSVEGKKVKAGGMIAAAAHKRTRHGKPFGRLTLEDYSGKFECMLWSEDYLKFKPFLAPGLFVYFEGTVVYKKWGREGYEFKIHHMELLNELGAKRTQRLQLQVDSTALSEETIHQLEKLCLRFAGECPLYINIKDASQNIHVELLSRKYKVNPGNEMMKELERIEALGIGAVQ